MKFKCKTYFDINYTGVTGHFKSSQIPFRDKSGQQINNEISWNLARNQQRNWETITQLISMRTQISIITVPVRNGYFWEFEFDVETPAAFGTQDDPIELLLSDADNVPMITGLWNIQNLEPVLIPVGEKQNIWFSVA